MTRLCSTTWPAKMRAASSSPSARARSLPPRAMASPCTRVPAGSGPLTWHCCSSWGMVRLHAEMPGGGGGTVEEGRQRPLGPGELASLPSGFLKAGSSRNGLSPDSHASLGLTATVAPQGSVMRKGSINLCISSQRRKTIKPPSGSQVTQSQIEIFTTLFSFLSSCLLFLPLVHSPLTLLFAFLQNQCYAWK